MRKYKAFTLAEVLLVLSIIGVIAAVTVPATMQQSAEKKFATLTKKSISTIQNAVDLKLTLVPTNPTDHGNNIFKWQLAGEAFGHSTLKAAASNNSVTTIQTPDGMIYNMSTYDCDNTVNKNNKLGCDYYFYVDLNGSEGPTKSTVNGIGGGTGQRDYDVIFYAMFKDGKIDIQRVWSSGANAEERNKRTKKYLGIN